MSETVLAALIGVGGIIVGGAVMWYVTLRKMPKELRVLGSEEQENLSVALNNAVAAYNTSLTAANIQRQGFEDRIKELERVQGERTQTVAALTLQIQILTDQIEALNREYAKQISALKHQWREWYETLKKWMDDNKLTGAPEPPEGLLETGKTKVIK